MNGNIMKTIFFHDIKYDLEGHRRLNLDIFLVKGLILSKLYIHTKIM